MIYLVAGLLVGVILGYLYMKNQFGKNYVPKHDFDIAQKTITDLQIENARRLSKEEVESGYVSRQLYENVRASLQSADGRTEQIAATVKEQQQRIIQLTGETNEKYSKVEVEKNYVARESFDIIRQKLHAAETDLDEKERNILRLNSELTELQQKENHLNDKLNTFKNELENLHSTMR